MRVAAGPIQPDLGPGQHSHVSIMELTPVRVYLMYTVPAAALLLTFLLLFPEMLVKNRFLPAVCKVRSGPGAHA